MKASSAFRTQIIREALARDATATVEMISVIGQEEHQALHRLQSHPPVPDAIGKRLETSFLRLNTLVERLDEIRAILTEKA